MATTNPVPVPANPANQPPAYFQGGTYRLLVGEHTTADGLVVRANASLARLPRPDFDRAHPRLTDAERDAEYDRTDAVEVFAPTYDEFLALGNALEYIEGGEFYVVADHVEERAQAAHEANERARQAQADRDGQPFTPARFVAPRVSPRAHRVLER